MAPDDIERLLRQVDPALVGVVSSVRRDGSPHAVPVWFSWDGQLVRIWSDPGRLWVRNVLREPRVAFTAQETERPYGAVIMRGHAEVSVDGPGLDDDIRSIARRYLRPEEMEDYLATWRQLRTIVLIRPERIGGWGRGY